jgi:hypothetical protein
MAHKRGGLLAQIEADIVDDSRLRAQVGLNTFGAIIELHNVNDTTSLSRGGYGSQRGYRIRLAQVVLSKPCPIP